MKAPCAWAVALLLIGLTARGAAASDGEIRDVRPTTLEEGDTLVIECEGLAPYGDVEVRIEGRFVGQPERFDAALAATPLMARPARGGRVLVDAAELRRWFGTSPRIERARILVIQSVAGEIRTWRSRDDDRVTLSLFPSTLRRLATEISGTRAYAETSGAAAVVAALPPAFVPALIVLVVALFIHALVAPLTGIVTVWERKIAGRMQSRLGPNRVGPRGWLQWLADALKMITKEDLIPADADRALFRVSPYLMWVSVFATFVVLPLSQTAIVADMNVGLLYLSSVTSLTVIAILLGGWASNSKWSLLGGMRSAAQIVSYELPASLALLQVALLAGSLSPQAIVRAQGGLPHEWFVFHNPLTFACFFIYFISALAEGNRAPFDLPEAESELVSGYNTEYSGFRFGIFFLAEWTNLYVMAAIVATMFLGGWNVPFVAPDELVASLPLRLLSLGLLLAKVAALVFVIIWVRWTLPRFRVDQMMALCWKHFIPIAFAAFLGTAAWLWLTSSRPLLALIVSWLTFLLGGVGLCSLFVARVVANFRATRLLYLGDRQFTLPFIEPRAPRRE